MKDPLGIVPQDIRARYERKEMIERTLKGKHSLDQALRDSFGPDVDCVLINRGGGTDDYPESVIPGYWHIRVRRPPPAIPHFIPITTPDGGYREPSPRVIGELAEIDLRRPEVKQRILEHNRTDSPQKAGERALKAEQRRDTMAEDYRAARRVRGEGGLKKSFQGKRKAT